MQSSKVNELNAKLKVIEETGIQYEKEVATMRRLRSLYEERARAAEAEHKIELERERARLNVANAKLRIALQDVRDLEEKKAELEGKIGNQDSRIDTLQQELSEVKVDLATKKEELYHSSSQIRLINSLLSQIISGPQVDLDRLAGFLEENHDLINEITTKGDIDNVASTLAQLSGGLEDSPDNDKQEIASNLSKVWRVLTELLSHHKASKTTFVPEVDSCYKSVETPTGPVLVISVSQTFIRLKDLILEKNSLVKEVGRLRKLNCHLETRLEEQESRLTQVTSELHSTWAVVNKLKTQHEHLHEHEMILRYELQQKRLHLNDLKKQLEKSRTQWAMAREKNSQTERDWKKLRAEFAMRKKLDCGSAESGYEDEQSPEDTDEEKSCEGEVEVKTGTAIPSSIPVIPEICLEPSSDSEVASSPELGQSVDLDSLENDVIGLDDSYPPDQGLLPPIQEALEETSSISSSFTEQEEGGQTEVISASYQASQPSQHGIIDNLKLDSHVEPTTLSNDSATVSPIPQHEQDNFASNVQVPYSESVPSPSDDLVELREPLSEEILKPPDIEANTSHTENAHKELQSTESSYKQFAKETIETDNTVPETELSQELENSNVPSYPTPESVSLSDEKQSKDTTHERNSSSTDTVQGLRVNLEIEAAETVVAQQNESTENESTPCKQLPSDFISKPAFDLSSGNNNNSTSLPSNSEPELQPKIVEMGVDTLNVLGQTSLVSVQPVTEHSKDIPQNSESLIINYSRVNPSSSTVPVTTSFYLAETATNSDLNVISTEKTITSNVEPTCPQTKQETENLDQIDTKTDQVIDTICSELPMSSENKLISENKSDIDEAKNVNQMTSADYSTSSLKIEAVADNFSSINREDEELFDSLENLASDSVPMLSEINVESELQATTHSSSPDPLPDVADFIDDEPDDLSWESFSPVIINRSLPTIEESPEENTLSSSLREEPSSHEVSPERVDPAGQFVQAAIVRNTEQRVFDIDQFLERREERLRRMEMSSQGILKAASSAVTKSETLGSKLDELHETCSMKELSTSDSSSISKAINSKANNFITSVSDSEENSTGSKITGDSFASSNIIATQIAGLHQDIDQGKQLHENRTLTEDHQVTNFESVLGSTSTNADERIPKLEDLSERREGPKVKEDNQSIALSSSSYAPVPPPLPPCSSSFIAEKGLPPIPPPLPPCSLTSPAENIPSTSSSSSQISNNEAPAKTRPTVLTEELLRRREERLKRMEESCKSLFTKMGQTSNRSEQIASKLDQIHAQYGEPSSTIDDKSHQSSTNATPENE